MQEEGDEDDEEVAECRNMSLCSNEKPLIVTLTTAQVHPDLWFLCDGCQKPIPGGKRRFATRRHHLCNSIFAVLRKL